VILVDTSVWIDYFNGVDSVQANILDRALQHDLIIVGDLILAELLQGFRSDKIAEEVRKKLLLCEFRNLVGYDIAIQAAANYRLLRSRGITVRKTIDMLIGTYCIHHGFRLLHNDRDFDPLEQFCGLKVVR